MKSKKNNESRRPKDDAFTNKICKLGPVSRIWIWNHLITITVNYPDELSSQWPMAFSFSLARTAKSRVVKCSRLFVGVTVTSSRCRWPIITLWWFRKWHSSNSRPSFMRESHLHILKRILRDHFQQLLTTVITDGNFFLSLPCGRWLQWLVFGHWYPISIHPLGTCRGHIEAIWRILRNHTCRQRNLLLFILK